MTSLSPPWSGLSAIASRVDLPSVVSSLLKVPEAERASFGRLREAGLRAPDALRVATEGPWRSSRPNIGFLHAGDAAWPESLYGLPFGAVAFSYEGALSLLTRPRVALVGSRACTGYGRELARRFAHALAEAGAVVVSGLAAGIDVAAHEGAAGATIAVLGQGIDGRMPAWQQRARDALLAQGGLVISELHPAAHADKHTFVVRNRIIAGLSRAVVVVEAGERSGARNTASHALGYGRDVLAVPGPLGAAASFGCLDLLEEGATMVRGVHTVLAAAAVTQGRPTPAADAPLDPASAALLALLAEPRTPEELLPVSGHTWAGLTAALGTLELTGRVVRLPGRRYQVPTR